MCKAGNRILTSLTLQATSLMHNRTKLGFDWQPGCSEVIFLSDPECCVDSDTKVQAWTKDMSPEEMLVVKKQSRFAPHCRSSPYNRMSPAAVWHQGV